MHKEQEMVPKKTKNHWAYLEEIEAPMWVDLTLEANSMNQESTDDWFYRSHPFHHCSAVQLKEMFSHSAAGNADFELRGLSSPKLPSSVSKSRGKHYKSRNWVTGNSCALALDKKNTEKSLSGKSNLCTDAGPIEEQKFIPSCGNTEGTCGVQASLVCKSGTGENVVPSNYKPVSSFGDLKASSSSTTITSDGNSTRTSGLLSILRKNLRNSYITRQASRVEINDRGQIKAHKHSSSKSSVGSSCSLLHDVNTTINEIQKKDRSLDNRNATRKISRVAINNGGQSKARKYYSSKSSVGSSSNLLYDANSTTKNVNTTINEIQKKDRRVDNRNAMRKISRVAINDGGQSKARKYYSSKSSVGSSSGLLYDANSTTKKIQKKDPNLDSRNVTRMSGVAKNRVKITSLSKATMVRVEDRTFDSKRESKTPTAKLPRKDVAKKVLHPAVHKKALMPLRVNEGDLLTTYMNKQKVRVNSFNRMLHVGKENAIGGTTESQRAGYKDASAGFEVRHQNLTRRGVIQKAEKTRLIGSKEKIINEDKFQRNATHKIYLR